MRTEPVSPTQLARTSQVHFFEAYRFSCACLPRELRLENHRLECANCGSPILRRQPTEATR